ncbi:MAG: hypothetical protein ACKOQ9_07740, partial [Verrucomicrobiota bacterium]
MGRALTLLAALLAPLAALHSQTPKPEAVGGFAIASPLKEFLGEPLLVPIQTVWANRGGSPRNSYNGEAIA